MSRVSRVRRGVVNGIFELSDPRALQLQGLQSGALTILGRVFKGSSGWRWHCCCACGRYVVVPAQSLLKKSTGRNIQHSCGCLRPVHGATYDPDSDLEAWLGRDRRAGGDLLTEWKLLVAATYMPAWVYGFRHPYAEVVGLEKGLQERWFEPEQKSRFKAFATVVMRELGERPLPSEKTLPEIEDFYPNRDELHGPPPSYPGPGLVIAKAQRYYVGKKRESGRWEPGNLQWVPEYPIVPLPFRELPEDTRKGIAVSWRVPTRMGFVSEVFGVKTDELETIGETDD